MLEDEGWRGFPMSAVSLPSRAHPGDDPVIVQLRQFAAAHGVLVPHGAGSLEPVWAALRAAGVDHPGLAYATWADSLALGGVLSSILTNSPDVAALLEGLERFHPLMDRDEIVLRRQSSSITVTLRAPGGGAAHPDTVDASFAMLTRGIRRLAGTLPSRVLLRRAAPLDPLPYRAAFGEVAFAQPADVCTFATATLANPVTNADPAILALVRPYAERRIAYQPLPWADQVSRVLAADPHTIPKLADVARSLTVSVRTLQLRLAEEGKQFTVLAEAVQRERALTLLAHIDLPITAIATRTGFATPSAFTRAVRRWTAMTPTRYRISQQAQ
jgi:AraC-like DNA-binding protein